MTTTIIAVIAIFFIIRNNYVYKRQIFAVNLVYEYIITIPYEEYKFKYDYYNKMIISHPKHTFSILLWGRYSAIKPKYIELLKKYDK